MTALSPLKLVLREACESDLSFLEKITRGRGSIITLFQVS